MDQGSEEWVKFALVEAERKKCIAKVLEVKSEDAVPKGQNYGSLMLRLKTKVVNGEGELQERNLIYKCLPLSMYRKYGMKQSGFFMKEAKMYVDVLPLLEKLFKECGVNETYWAEFYAVRGNNEGYIMQDLKPLGYKVLDRTIGLDFEHASFVFDALAKFHAGTCALIERGEIIFSDFVGYYFASHETIATMVYKKNLEQLANVLENKWKGEWVEYGARLRRYCDSYYPKLANEFKCLPDNRFKVLCHADPWTTNIMLIHDKNNKPVSLKFIDFQVSLIGTPAFDLEYFFLTSLKQSDYHRRKELQELYLRALKGYLELFGAMSEVPTLAELEEDSKGIQNFLFVTSLTLKPLMTMPSEDAPDLDKKTDEMVASEGKESIFTYDCENSAYVDSIKATLRSAKENGLI